MALGGIGDDTFELEVIDLVDPQDEKNWCTVPDLPQSRPGAFAGFLQGDESSNSGPVLCGGRNNSGCSILTKEGSNLEWNVLIEQHDKIGDYSAVVSLDSGLWITGVENYFQKHNTSIHFLCTQYRWQVQQHCFEPDSHPVT